MAAATGAQRRTERLLNLVVYLLGTERGVTRAELRIGIEDYRGSPSDDAFERKFERDKQDLRDLGIPLITHTGSNGFADEISYRIDRWGYQLPDVDFTTAERAVLVIAARAWEQAALGSAATGALRKLGVASDLVPLPPVMTSLAPTEAAFDSVYSAVRDRVSISFDYVGSGASESQTRHLEPWVLVSRNGSWYIAGHDTDRQNPRVFRLSRMVGEVTRTSPHGSVIVPPSALERAAAIDLVRPDSESVQVHLRVRPGRGHALRRRASSITPAENGWDAVVIDDADPYRFVGEVTEYAADVVVDAPALVRHAVIESLRAVQQVHA